MPTRKTHDDPAPEPAEDPSAPRPDEDYTFEKRTGGKPGVAEGDETKQAEEKGYLGETPADIEKAKNRG